MHYDQLPFTEGYVTTVRNGIDPNAPMINWPKALKDNYGLVGSPANTYNGWQHAADTPVIAETPLNCPSSGWPSRLFRVGIPHTALIIPYNPHDKRVIQCNTARVLEEENPIAILGSQATQLAAMAKAVTNITRSQQERLIEAYPKDSSEYLQAVITIVGKAGRTNTTSCMERVIPKWPSQKIWAYPQIENAVTAVAHADLLVNTKESQEILYYLLRPWQEVMAPGRLRAFARFILSRP